jgi:hypothetical protein
MKYYVRIGTDAPQVLTPQQIFAFIKEGKVTAQTKACVVGASSWTELGQLVPQLFAPDAKPPEEEHGAMEFVGKAGHFLAEHGGEVASLAKVFMRRIFASNFVAEAALPEERAILEKADIPVKSPMAQNFAAWRRAMLWFSGIALIIATILTIIVEAGDTFRPMVPPVIRNMWIALQVISLLSPVLVIMAALRWMNMRRSRRRARWGWFLQFFGPLLLLLLPVKHLTTNEDLARAGLAANYEAQVKQFNERIDQASGTDRSQLKEQLEAFEKDFKEREPDLVRQVLATESQNIEQARTGIAAAMGLFVFITLAPRVVGLFPGIVRSSLTLRTLVPESPVPGYIIALIEPLFMVFIMVCVVIAAQAGNALTFFGLLAFLASTFMLMREVRTLCTPMNAEAMNAHIKPLRKRLLIVAGIGIILILVGLHEAWKEVGGWKIAAVVGHLIGNIFLLTAVASDFFIGLMKFSFDQEKQIRTSPLYSDMENRFADLSQVRMAQIIDEETGTYPAVQPPSAPPPNTPSGPTSPQPPV